MISNIFWQFACTFHFVFNRFLDNYSNDVSSRRPRRLCLEIMDRRHFAFVIRNAIFNFYGTKRKKKKTKSSDRHLMFKR